MPEAVAMRSIPVEPAAGAVHFGHCRAAGIPGVLNRLWWKPGAAASCCTRSGP